MFFREHEKWQREDRYLPNVADTMSIPFGDLAANDPATPASVLEPRRIQFATDSLGFRNRSDYAGHKVVLVGDSFVAGMGTDQDQILSEILTSEFGLPTYSLGFPSGPAEYQARAKAFLSRLAPGALFAFMIFEGNDFAFDQPIRVGHLYDRARGRFIRDYLPFLAYPRVLFGMSRRAQARLGLASDTWVEIHRIGPEEVAFSRFYIEAVLRSAPRYSVAEDAQVLRRTGCVFFVPEKYRVYKEHLRDGRTLAEPAPGFLALKAFYEPQGVPVVDLTPALRAASRTLLAQGQYAYWRDDTHWNGRGMQAAAPLVQECLQRRLSAVR
jgi:hypothetical protein